MNSCLYGIFAVKFFNHVTRILMKILHTADLHIREYNDARWQALQELIQLGQAREIDVLVISG
ncbi:MAG: metallophosphoesterase, partial [Calditrichaeota bacterium]|nr:metallophosphoesterase [Calditrichota bacterium]